MYSQITIFKQWLSFPKSFQREQTLVTNNFKTGKSILMKSKQIKFNGQKKSGKSKDEITRSCNIISNSNNNNINKRFTKTNRWVTGGRIKALPVTPDAAAFMERERQQKINSVHMLVNRVEQIKRECMGMGGTSETETR